MKKFLTLYLGYFIGLPLAFCIVIYSIACFISWNILPVHVEWVFVRFYILGVTIISIVITLDKDL